MTEHGDEDERIAQEARQWVAMRGTQRARQEAVKAAFMHWLLTSNAHVHHWFRAAATEHAVRWRRRTAVGRPAFQLTRVAAAVILLSVSTLAVWSLTDSTPWVTYGPISSARRIELQDGSQIELEPGTVLETHIGWRRREVRLRTGGVRFSVRHQTMNRFRVHLPAAEIEVLGTQFHVRVSPSATTVLVELGLVRLTGHGNPESLALHSGQQATVAADGRVAVYTPLVRSGTLATWAEAFNQKNPSLRIRVNGKASLRQFDANIDLSDPEGFIELLRQSGLAVERTDAGVIVHEANPRRAEDTSPPNRKRPHE